MKAILIKNFGGPDVLEYTEIDTPKPQAGDLLVRNEAIGINFIDIYRRTGLYKVELPYIPGLEGAGVVEEIGESVQGFKRDDRAAYAGVPSSYAEYTIVPAERAVALPGGISSETGAAVMLQGMTAHYLAKSTYTIQKGDRVLVHAGAGGVGLLLIQIAKNLGAKIITTVSTDAKADLAKKAGADEVILYTKSDFPQEVKRITEGKGVNVVYDSVGKSTFEKSLDCLSPRGMLVLFGQSSGKVEAFDPAVLNTKGSLFLTRPSLFHYIADRSALVERATDLFQWIQNSKLNVRIGKTFSLNEAGEAHSALENRKTTGKVLLVP